jgi:hypothetical protein
MILLHGWKEKLKVIQDQQKIKTRTCTDIPANWIPARFSNQNINA